MALLKDAKFIAVNLMVLLVLGFVILSGDGQKVVIAFYEDISGQKYEVFSPVEDRNNETYIVLRDKLSRDKNIDTDDVDVSLLQKSDVLHKYRVVYGNETWFYNVQKNSNGIWQIKQE